MLKCILFPGTNKTSLDIWSDNSHSGTLGLGLRCLSYFVYLDLEKAASPSSCTGPRKGSSCPILCECLVAVRSAENGRTGSFERSQTAPSAEMHQPMLVQPLQYWGGTLYRAFCRCLGEDIAMAKRPQALSVLYGWAA